MHKSDILRAISEFNGQNIDDLASEARELLDTCMTYEEAEDDMMFALREGGWETNCVGTAFLAFKDGVTLGVAPAPEGTRDMSLVLVKRGKVVGSAMV